MLISSPEKRTLVPFSKIIVAVRGNLYLALEETFFFFLSRYYIYKYILSHREEFWFEIIFPFWNSFSIGICPILRTSGDFEISPINWVGMQYLIEKCDFWRCQCSLLNKWLVHIKIFKHDFTVIGHHIWRPFGF